MNNRSKKLLSLLLRTLLVLTVATTFVSLGLWQWDRAQQHQELEAELASIASLERVELTSIFPPIEALDGEIANRLVRAEGRYLQFFTAPNQAHGDYEVGLFEVSGSSPRAAILVARQILGGESSEVAPRGVTGRVEISARILPTQREDLSESKSLDRQELPRIDSALLVEELSDSSLALYDGYLLLQEERINGEQSSIEKIPDQIAEPTIPGYYWQHISYVVIWFLMAALVLYLPFYQVRRNRLVQEEKI